MEVWVGIDPPVASMGGSNTTINDFDFPPSPIPARADGRLSHLAEEAAELIEFPLAAPLATGETARAPTRASSPSESVRGRVTN